MDCLLKYVTVSLPDQERWNFDGLAFAIVTHVNVFLHVVVDNDRHDSTELLNVLYFLDKVAVAAVDHNNLLVAIRGCFLEMSSIELTFVELLAAVLI